MKEFKKYDHGKPRVSLIPPDSIIGLAYALTHGANKYGAHNWCNGPDWSRYLDALMRHVVAFAAGQDIDEDSGLPTIDHVQACAAILSALQKRKIGRDDRQPVGAQPEQELSCDDIIDSGGL
jgi:hypothetical protein